MTVEILKAKELVGQKEDVGKKVQTGSHPVM
jgi:hypothetical protein